MESIRFLSGGVQLHATRWEGSLPNAGTSILALHGFTGDALDFAPLVQQTSACLRWHGLDLLGHGFSDAPDLVESYSAKAHGQYIQDAERELGLRQYVLLGYSMGARMALHYALEHSENIAALVLVGGHAGLPDPKERAQRVADDEALAERVLKTPMRAFIDAWSQQSIIASQKNIKPEIRAEMLERRYRNHPTGLAHSLRAFGTGAMPVLWERMIGFDVPTLLVSGAEDIKFSTLARHLERRLPKVMRAQIFGAGHCAHLEQPQRFCRLLEKFVRIM